MTESSTSKLGLEGKRPQKLRSNQSCRKQTREREGQGENLWHEEQGVNTAAEESHEKTVKAVGVFGV